jgi:hypothetical protein
VKYCFIWESSRHLMGEEEKEIWENKKEFLNW